MLKIRKLRNGKYMIDYTFGPRGRRRRQKIYGFNNRAEAENLKAEIALRPLDQVLDYQKVIDVTLDEAIEKYLTTLSYKKESFELEKKYFDKLKKFFESKSNFDGKILTISLLDMQEFQNDLLDSPYTRSKDQTSKKAIKRTISPATVNRHFNTYRNFFESCRMWNFIRRSPCEFLKNIEVEEKRRKPWTVDQCAHVFSTLPEWAQRVLFGIAGTGARRAELCRLLIEKIDLEKGVVVLRSKKGKGKIKEREAPMTPGFKKFITEQVLMAKKNKWPYVFVNHEGSEISMAYLTNLVTRKSQKLGYKGLTIHGLRHTLLSQLANSGTSLNAVRELAGHTNLRTTQIYLHTPVEQVKEGLTQLESTGMNWENLSAKGHFKGGQK